MDSPISTLATDLGEAVLDSTLDDGLLRDIPVLGTVVNIARAAASIRDRILLQKIRAFLAPCVSLTEEDRANFRNRMLEDQGFKSRVEEVLVLHLDRCDALKKAQILGAIFMGLVRGTIDIEAFHRLIYCVDRSFVADLATLDRYPKPGEKGYRNTRMDPIALSDLMRQSNMIECHITREGQKLLQLMRDANVA